MEQSKSNSLYGGVIKVPSYLSEDGREKEQERFISQESAKIMKDTPLEVCVRFDIKYYDVEPSI